MLPDRLELAVDPSYEIADGTRGVRVTYSEEAQQELQGYSVVIIADTLRPIAPLDFLNEKLVEDRLQILNPQRITTLVARFPRCILAEYNTHRVFSRNSASSRARSIKVVVREIMEDPYIPLFTENRKGMSGGLLDEAGQARARVSWLDARDSAVAAVLNMLAGTELTGGDVAAGAWESVLDEYYQHYLDFVGDDAVPFPESYLNVHKQNANRLLEPFMWHEAVVTSTEWTNFLQLRDHDEADPAIHGIAKLMEIAFKTSVPVERAIHAPFAGELVREFEALGENIISTQALKKAIEAANYTAGAAAQVSYRPVSDGGTGANPAKLADRLLAMSHLSPFEHAAFSSDWIRSLGIRDEIHSNFSGEWTQHRALLWHLQKITGRTGLPAVLEVLG